MLIHKIHQDATGPGYELHATLEGQCLELYTVWPGARDPSPHRVLQLNMPKRNLRDLAWMLIDQSEE